MAYGVVRDEGSSVESSSNISIDGGHQYNHRKLERGRYQLAWMLPFSHEFLFLCRDNIACIVVSILSLRSVCCHF